MTSINPDPAAPTATTPRLHLRLLTAADAPAMFAIRSDWENMKWATGPVETLVEQTEHWLCTKILAKPAEIMNFAIELRSGCGADADADAADASGVAAGVSLEQPANVIGVVGALHGHEVGYMLARAHHGRGYATEALHALLQLYWAVVPRPGASAGAGTGAGAAETAEQGDETLARGWDFVEGVVDPENRASARVLVKCGFRLWSSTRDDFESPNLGTRSTAVYRLARPGTELAPPPGPFEIDMGPSLS